MCQSLIFYFLVFQLKKKDYESLLEFALSQSMTQKNKANTLQLQFFTYACHSPVLFMVMCTAMIPFHTSFFPCLKKNKIK